MTGNVLRTDSFSINEILIEDVGISVNSLFFNEHLLIYRVLVHYRNKTDSKLNICYDRNKYVKVMEILYRIILKT